VIFIGGQRARITEQRVRRGRIQFIKQAALFENSVKYSASIEYAEQTDEIIRHALRTCQTGTPGPVYIEYRRTSSRLTSTFRGAAAFGIRLVEPGADGDMIAKAVELIKAAKNPILMVGHAVQCTRAGAKVKALQEVLQCPASRPPAAPPSSRDWKIAPSPTCSPASATKSSSSRTCDRHGHRAGRADALRP